MKKLKRSSELLWAFGILFVALGVTICSKADLGVSMIAAPAFVISEAISSLISGFSVGVTEYVIQGVILIILCIVVGRFNWRYLLAFAVAVIYGYTLDLFLWLFAGIQFNYIWLRWVMLIVGDIITAFGVACFFRTYMPLQVYELFVAEVSNRFSINITRVKLCFDLSLLALSIILAVTLFGDALSFDWSSIYYSSFHSIGLGTLITTIINSPIISFMGKLIDKTFDNTPRFEGLSRVLKRN
jgi:uncharacterized membrane protein YczE